MLGEEQTSHDHAILSFMYDPFEDEKLLNIENYEGRLRAFLSLDGLSDFSSLVLLVPGSALGGEVFSALELGARHVTGLEVDQKLIDRSKEISSIRNSVDRTSFQFFNGSTFPNIKVDIVLSGHVIEHTTYWKGHLDECFKVLNDGGRIYLEFPTRYNFKELHTGFVSFEYLPSTVRSIMNKTSAYVGRVLFGKDYYNRRMSIQTTLQQVGSPQIKKHIRNRGFRIQAKERPAKGIVRLIIGR